MEAGVRELVEALRPFAEAADDYDGEWTAEEQAAALEKFPHPDDQAYTREHNAPGQPHWKDEEMAENTTFEVRDLRRAREAVQRYENGVT